MKRGIPAGVAITAIVSAMLSSPIAVAAPSGVRILSASWGLNNGTGCPGGERGLDNIPVTFDWYIRDSSIDVGDFLITRDDGSTTTPVCALQFPPDELNERQTVNLIGDFGDPSSARPVKVSVVGALQGQPIGATRWHDLPRGLTHAVDQIEGGPYMVDAWVLTKGQLKGDLNRCTVGKTFVRVVWSNGLTAYPDGSEIGASVVASYRAVFTLPSGKSKQVRPLAVGDLADHSSTANDDNMHDLCLPALPRGAVLVAVKIGAEQIQDPNGDPNGRQTLTV